MHLAMDPLTAYYVNQSGGRLGQYIGPLYAGSPYVQHGSGLGSFLGSLFRIVKPILLSGAKSLGREALTTGANIMSDIAAKQTGTKVKDIVAKRVTEGTKNLASKLQQGKGKRKRPVPKNTSKIKKSRDIFG